MRLGVLDIGSNTVHLLLVDAHPGARPVPFASHKRPLQLVAYLDEAGNIKEEGQHELVAFVREAREFAERHEAEDLLAFCTSAIREAGNGEAVLDRVKSETTVSLMELSGAQEAAMTFRAARRWHGWSAGTILDLDIGGGSFEMALGQDALPDFAQSVPLGAGRLTRDWLEGDPPTAKSVKDLRKYIRSTLKPVVKEFAARAVPDLVVGTSKTFRSLARITGAAPSTAGPYIRRELRHDDLALWIPRIAAMTVADRVNLPGVSEIRAPQLLAGAMVAEAAMDLFSIRTLQICPWALREGLILQRLDYLQSEGMRSFRTVGVGHVDLRSREYQLAAMDGRPE